MEGFMSAFYHICPTNANFQFGKWFMIPPCKPHCALIMYICPNNAVHVSHIFSLHMYLVPPFLTLNLSPLPSLPPRFLSSLFPPPFLFLLLSCLLPSPNPAPSSFRHSFHVHHWRTDSREGFPEQTP